jgi:hypothetical protein
MRDYTWNYALWGRMASCAPVGNRRLLARKDTIQ